MLGAWPQCSDVKMDGGYGPCLSDFLSLLPWTLSMCYCPLGRYWPEPSRCWLQNCSLTPLLCKLPNLRHFVTVTGKSLRTPHPQPIRAVGPDIIVTLATVSSCSKVLCTALVLQLCCCLLPAATAQESRSFNRMLDPSQPKVSLHAQSYPQASTV